MSYVWQTEGITLIYPSRDGGTTALANVNVQLSPGEVVVLQGPSGSGKSSLLYCLAGLLKPSEGSLMYCGEDVTRWSKNRWALLRRTEIRFVPQIPAVIPYLTIEETLRLTSPKGDMDRLNDLLEKFDLLRYKSFYPHQLSVGGRQRLTFVRAIAQRGRGLILDEPTASLDDEMTERVVDELNSAAEGGMAVVMATHDPRALPAHARVYSIANGHIIDGSNNPLPDRRKINP